MVITVIRKSKYFKYIVAFGIIKKVILLVMFLVPLLSFSQVTFNDLMSIDSKDTFIKLMIDSEYSGIKSDVSDITFALNPDTDENGEPISSSFSYFYTFNNTFEFEFVRNGTYTNTYTGAVVREGIVSNPYEPILRKVKRKCEYVKIRTIGTRNYAIYDCNNKKAKAKFGDLIGLTLSGQSGIVKTFNR